MTPAITLDVVPGSWDDRSVVPSLQRLAGYVAEVASEVPIGSWSVVVRIVTDVEITDLHERFLGDAEPTDIITFPAGDTSNEDGHLGDIAISLDTAACNAVAVGHSTEREIAFLLLHGLLHLFGYDDHDPADRERMLQRQDELLTGFEGRWAVPWR